MAILSSMMDVSRLNSLGGVTTNTYPHSLATTPDLSLPVLRSAASSSSNAALLGLGANASLATVALAGASANSGVAQVVAFDLWNIYFWGAIR